jgi:hypothetical protein
MLKNVCIGAAVVMGTLVLANGLFMLVSPIDWCFAVPGVTTTGPFNQLFIRDIGLIFLFVGAAYLIGAARLHYRVVLWAAPTLWLAGHAVFHLWKVAVGICEPSVIGRDFPAVSLPAIVGAVLTLWTVRAARQSNNGRC